MMIRLNRFMMMMIHDDDSFESIHDVDLFELIHDVDDVDDE